MIMYWFNILRATIKNWLDSQAFIYAAALAFFTVFSIAPVLVVVVALVGLVIGESAVKGQLFAQLEGTLGPDAAETIQTAVANSQIDQSGIWPALIGIIATIVGATTVFAKMQQSLNQIWGVAPLLATTCGYLSKADCCRLPLFWQSALFCWCR